MSTYLFDRVRAHPRVTVRTGTQVTALAGIGPLSTVTLTEKESGVSNIQACSGLFCFIGADPATAWLTGIALHDDGFIRTDAALREADLGPVRRRCTGHRCRSRPASPAFSRWATCGSVP